MKLIIDISKEVYNGIKIGMRNRDDMREIGEAVENGKPLDDLRAEIEGELEQDNHSFYRAALEDVLKIIDKYREGEQP